MSLAIPRKRARSPSPERPAAGGILAPRPGGGYDTRALIAAALAQSAAASSGVSSSAAMTGATPANRPQRRVYVSSVPTGTTELEIVRYFNEAITKAHGPPAPGGPAWCLAAALNSNSSRQFCFLEFSSPPAAAAALLLDGTLFKGERLKLKRPNDYVLPPGAVEAAPLSMNLGSLQLVGGAVPDGPNKLFVSGCAGGWTRIEAGLCGGRFSVSLTHPTLHPSPHSDWKLAAPAA